MNWLTQKMIDIANAILSILPNSPFLILDNLNTSEFEQYFRWLNWFLPVSEILTVFTIWCASIAIYYVVQIVLRWTKTIV